MQNDYAQQPLSLSELEETLKQFAKLEPVDDCFWMNRRTWDKLSPHFKKLNAEGAFGVHSPSGMMVYYDETLNDGSIEAGTWMRADKFEEGLVGLRKLVRHRYTI
jgi:hypothetical protein